MDTEHDLSECLFCMTDFVSNCFVLSNSIVPRVVMAITTVLTSLVLILTMFTSMHVVVLMLAVDRANLLLEL